MKASSIFTPVRLQRAPIVSAGPRETVMAGKRLVLIEPQAGA